MSDKKEKDYSAYEAAIAVLNKVQDMYKTSNVYKSNSSHELEPGEEPNNDDAECPDYLSEAESSPLGEGGEGKKKKKAEGSQPAHEEDMSEEEDKEHDAQEQGDDEQDSDNIEADEEKGEYDQDADEIVENAASDKKGEKKKENPFQKSEHGQEYKPELMRKKKDYHENAQKSEEDVAKFCKYCGSAKQHEEAHQEQGEAMDLKKPSKLGSFMDQKKEKNKKMEKMLGIQEKQDKQGMQKPMSMEKKPSGMKGY